MSQLPQKACSSSDETCRIKKTVTPQVGRGPGRRGAQRGGEAGRGGAERDVDRSHRSKDDRPLLPSRASTTIALNIYSQAQYNEITCKPMKEQSLFLTTGTKSGSSMGQGPLFHPGC